MRVGGQCLGFRTWSTAPMANSCHPLRTVSTLKTQSRSAQGLRAPALDNVFIRPTTGCRLPCLGGDIRVESVKGWRGRATMSLIALEAGRMLFCALTACAAAAQVRSGMFYLTMEAPGHL